MYAMSFIYDIGDIDQRSHVIRYDNIKESLVNQLPSVSWQSFVFDYLSFCRSINIYIIRYISAESSSASNRLLLQEEIYGLFMRKYSKLKYLDMRTIKNQIFKFPEAKLRFESLFYDGVAELISVQKNLKYFEWEDTHWFRIAESASCKEIFLALRDTITHLKLIILDIVDMLSIVLPKLHKLKTLIINNLDVNEEQSKMCIYRDHEIFMVDHYNLKTASIIIENTGGCLKKIFLKSYNIYYGNFELIFIRKIHEHCPLIEYLCLSFSPSKEHFTELEKLY
ncbi:hypothetical protein RclHR1_01390022 [Rhizophagus clarus]|uniref:F-box domain-containing protein n=1 Tax=Rhizophagus clarus TaxID=94130 RepID=A0A2Z6QFQ8_9GLOM|nr:hypothetical protein RclHR1_01390022 [Rhizophagus clarus]